MEAVKIFNRKSIALKTFLFTAALVSLAIVISFGVLYFTLPSYYFYIKNKNLDKNAGLLADKIEAGGSDEDILHLIVDFSVANNANVMSFAEDDGLIVGLSSPFSAIFGRNIVNRWTYASDHFMIASDEPINISIEKVYLDDSRPGNYPAIYSSQSQETENRIPTAAARIAQASTITINKKLDHDYIDRIVITGTLQPIDEAKNVIISLAPYLLAINIFLAFIAAYLYSRRMTKPIVALSEAAAKMRLLTPDIVSGIRTGDELGKLSENLDLMYLSLCSNIENLRCEMEKVSILERSKADFMRAASHELKTPLAALNGITEGMIDNVGKYKNKEKYLLESKHLINNLAKLIGEILRASKMDTTENIIQPEQINAAGFLDTIIKDYLLFIDEKKINLVYEACDMQIESDPNMLRTVLSNIVSNAVKYTGDNEIIIIKAEETGGEYVISVENKCDGIPLSDLPKLFEPFYTQNYSRSRIHSGSGLGLYIVKRNLEMLHLRYKMENTMLGLKFSIFFEQ